MKKVLFIDRDGTLIVEPPHTKQINCLEELIFLPNVISSLKKLYENGYEFVMITNQDGLGTSLNPKSNYDLINKKIFEVFMSEGFRFTKVFECPHFESDNCLCRKPKIGMVEKYLQQTHINREKSFVIGDRQSDIEFANHIDLSSYLIGKNNWNWSSITKDILLKPRKVSLTRKTKETNISIQLNLDGKGIYNITTGLNFFNHMLEQLSKHSNFDIEIVCKGDLHIDEHHTIEDTAILLGQAFKEALGDKRGIERYAWERILVMDEAKTEISIDLSGRPYLICDFEFTREYVGDFPTEMLKHFFDSFCYASGTNLHILMKGQNTHHLIECCFKAFAKCLKDATKKTNDTISSTKGIL